MMRVKQIDRHKIWLKRMFVAIHLIAGHVISLDWVFTLHFRRKLWKEPKDCFHQRMSKREPLQKPVLSNCNWLSVDTRKNSRPTSHSVNSTPADFGRELQLVPQVGLPWRHLSQPLLDAGNGVWARCWIAIGTF